MKKSYSHFLSSILVVIFTINISIADEGMWLPFLIGEKTYQDMVKKGLKLTKEQIYSANKASLKDAIIIFGGGCTGEIVSNNGLIFTNHHCGYDAIAKSSTVEHNYLKNGFWAKNFNEEIYVPGLTVQFLERIDDVTEKVNKQLANINENNLLTELPKKLNELALAELKDNEKNNGCEAKIVPMFSGNQYILFIYKRYKDVRFVGTPPESLGKFGGDTDNWEWPRHTADFSIFRVYADKNGNVADYSPNNVPLKPKYVVPVSLKGVQDNSFAMIVGFPGGTNRFETSYGVKLKTSIDNPNIVELRDTRLKLMFNEMKKDEAVKLKLASYYARVANYWKFFDGENKQLLKYHVLEEKQSDEKKFLDWATKNNKSEYLNLMKDFESCYNQYTPFAKAKIYYNECINGSQLINYATRFISVYNALKNNDTKTITTNKEKILSDFENFVSGEDLTSEKNTLMYMLSMYYTQIDKSFIPEKFYSSISDKNLNQADTYKAFVEKLTSQTIFLNTDKLKQWLNNPDTTTLSKDPAFQTALIFNQLYKSKVEPEVIKFNACNFALMKKYQKGLLEMYKGKDLYPDANFTMRLTYGKVSSYSPKDAVTYKYYCTLSGVLDKYKPGDYEFDLPKDFIEAAKKKDFGKYEDKNIKDIVVTFVTTDDITGGNSGSPVLNGNGELIGLAFDGNYEALSHKIAFDAKYNRTICVDIRYVLWVVDKIGHADNIIKELNIKM